MIPEKRRELARRAAKMTEGEQKCPRCLCQLVEPPPEPPPQYRCEPCGMTFHIHPNGKRLTARLDGRLDSHS